MPYTREQQDRKNEQERRRRQDPEYLRRRMDSNNERAKSPEYLERKRLREARRREQGIAREESRRSTAKRRARLREVECSLTLDQWAEILDYFDYRCYVCAGPAEDMEHVIPIYKGGTHNADNVRPACRDCNRGPGGKHGRDFWEWLPERLAELREASDRTKSIAAERS